MNLNRMPKPAKRARNCGLSQLPQTSKGKSQKAVETVSVFEMKSVYGWWPAITTDGDEPTIAVRTLFFLSNVCNIVYKDLLV